MPAAALLGTFLDFADDVSNNTTSLEVRVSLSLESSLRSKLESYSASGAPQPSGTAFRPAWGIYAAAATSALAMATSAEASVITGFSGMSITAPTNATFFTSGKTVASFPGLGSLKIGLSFNNFPGNHYAKPAFKVGTAYLLRDGTYAQRLNPGVLVSAGAPGTWEPAGFYRPVVYGTAANTNGNFLGGVYGYAAFYLPGNLYGWIELKWEKVGPSGLPDQITAGRWAYDDSGAPIAAGFYPAAAVPEPGTWGLSLLATGAMGILAWRRRNRPSDGELQDSPAGSKRSA
jgi:hypothetical protein